MINQHFLNRKTSTAFIYTIINESENMSLFIFDCTTQRISINMVRGNKEL